MLFNSLKFIQQSKFVKTIYRTLNNSDQNSFLFFEYFPKLLFVVFYLNKLTPIHKLYDTSHKIDCNKNFNEDPIIPPIISRTIKVITNCS